MDLHRGYQRPKIITIDDDKDLSDHIKFRLWLARNLALMRHKEKWA
jgi:aromatic ring-cleaving dioxygenase